MTEKFTSSKMRTMLDTPGSNPISFSRPIEALLTPSNYFPALTPDETAAQLCVYLFRPGSRALGALERLVCNRGQLSNFV